MIFYFSGTGNSLAVAKAIGEIQQEKLISIVKELDREAETYEYDIDKDEKIIFIFPIYAWAPPVKVIQFIEELVLRGYENQYVTCIATCGQNVGLTLDLIQKKLETRGLKLDSGFSIAMPNNYMLLGDVEKSEQILPKLKVAKDVVAHINELISNKVNEIFEVVPGPLPNLFTKVINPFFQDYAMNVKNFYATDDCIGCKICERICNGSCIKVEQKPIWHKGCTQCMACINYCPKSAIQYGKKTKSKGRYVHPEILINEMFLR